MKVRVVLIVGLLLGAIVAGYFVVRAEGLPTTATTADLTRCYPFVIQ